MEANKMQELIFGLIGGTALLMYGVKLMGEGLEKASGDTMKKILTVLTGNGHVGAGLGKATEIPEAIRKGKEDAAKHLVKVSLDENNSITHDHIGKYGSARDRKSVV